jgi:PAS domain S-box-containing protein
MHQRDAILIVDDDEVTRRMMTLVCGKKGYETETAETGREAIKKAQERFFNVALLDIMLPDLEGIELIAPLKKLHPDMEMIIITAFASVENAVRALNEGASAYITKPLNMDEVFATIRKALEKQHLVMENRRLYQETQRELAERRLAEEALRESEERYRLLFSSGNDAVFVHHPTAEGMPGKFIEVNDIACERYGYTKEELLDLTPLDLKVPEEREGGIKTRVKKLAAERHLLYETVQATKDGRRIPVEIHSHLFELKGQPTVISVARDITERKRANRQMRLLSAAIETSPECISITDMAGNVIYANKGAERMVGIPAKDIVGKKILSFLPDPIRGEHILKDVFEESYLKGESKITDPEGRQFWASSTTSLIMDEKNHPLGLVGKVEDISDRREAEQKKIQLKKMGALGTLTAGIAHELNNPMMGMLNFIQYCLKHTAKDNKTFTVLEDAERETKRCIDIVGNLLTFSRIEKEDEERFKKDSLPMVFDRVFKLLSYRIEKENILLTQEYSEDTPEIWLKVSNIQQVFLNIIGNALDALKESKKKEIHVEIRLDGQSVMVTITDSGCGISPENLQNIFDPFFTTKPTGQGTGLGLSVCHSIVKAHGGEITCESEVGLGTTFHILLPKDRRTRS